MLDLSPQQKAAVQYIKGPLLVVGGAGSGKTSLLAHKIAWLVREYDTPPDHIAAIAGDAAAARMIRARVADLLGRQAPALQISTFAEMGLALIEQRLDLLDLRPGFSLYDRLDSEAVIARLLREARPDLVGLAAAVARQIACWKRQLAPLPSTAVGGSSVAELAAWSFRRYEQRLHTANAIDIEDLVGKAVHLLATEAALLGEWRARFGFLLVDEYDRVEASEHELTRLLTADGPVLTAAGDDMPPRDDSVRDNLSRLRAETAGIQVIRLDRNFRSTQRISRCAAVLIRRRSPADTSSDPTRALGARLRVIQARNDQQEADGVVDSLLAHKARSGCDYRDYAILLTRPEQAPPIEHALQTQRIPLGLRGGPSFLDQAEVRDLRAYLRLMCNPADDVAFLRAVNTPRRDIDRPTLENLMSFAANRTRPLLQCALDPALARGLTPGRFAVLQDVATMLRAFGERAAHSNPVQLAHDLIANLRYDEWLRDTCNDLKIAERRMQSVMDFVGWLRRLAKRRPEADLRVLVAHLSLISVLDADGPEAAEGVALMPIGAARGLEFAHVYVVGFEESAPAGTLAPADANDARRLAYLAISRARESVAFTVVEHRRVAGEVAQRRPSRLLAELPTDDIEYSQPTAESSGAEAVIARAVPGRGERYPRGYG